MIVEDARTGGAVASHRAVGIGAGASRPGQTSGVWPWIEQGAGGRGRPIELPLGAGDWPGRTGMGFGVQLLCS
jgi:hypothetical protein